MTLINLENITAKEMVPGFWGRFVHSENFTLAVWQIESGAALPLHAHPHEQVTSLLEGEFELTIGTQTHLLTPGKVAIVPSNVPHTGKARTPCRIMDVFYPLRQEYQN